VDSIELLGVRVDDATYEDLLSSVDRFIAEGCPHQVVTLNPEMLVAAAGDPDFAALLNAADLNVADGVGLMLAARVLGHPLRQRVTGSDGIYRLAAHCAKRGYRLFLLGAAPGVAEVVAHKLQNQFPGLEVAGTYSGSAKPEDLDPIVSLVQSAKPHLLLVAYGVPVEEIWIAQNRARLGVPVMVGVGGTFDFVAGVTKRAPSWMRRFGLEWLHRLVLEPWRWRRQLALPRFAIMIVGQRLGIGPGK
jgi:N-acetylglucosaminyldiphosphoundecaprenol N-acetyl-beta-D-mannosaminyltransferase